MNVGLQSLERVVRDMQAFSLRSSLEISQIKAEINAIPLDSQPSSPKSSHLGQFGDRKI